MEHNSAFRKEEILPLGTTWLTVEDVMLSERRQTQEHNLISLTHKIRKVKHRERE
jgi:hypothetical protein